MLYETKRIDSESKKDINTIQKGMENIKDGLSDLKKRLPKALKTIKSKK